MAKVISKLVIVRKAKAEGFALGTLAAYQTANITNISPLAWSDEEGVSHIGFVLTGMKLTALRELSALVESFEGATLLDLEGDQEADILAALDRVGLRLNELAD